MDRGGLSGGSYARGLLKRYAGWMEVVTALAAVLLATSTSRRSDR